MSEARTDDRLDRLEEDVREIKAMLTGLVPLINRIDAQLPHLATNAELADLRGETRTGFADLRGELRSGLAVKPSHAYLWGVMAAMVGSQAVILAAAALALVIFQMLPAHGAVPPQRPYSCRLLDAAERACALSLCAQRERERLREECLRDGGRP